MGEVMDARVDGAPEVDNTSAVVKILLYLVAGVIGLAALVVLWPILLVAVATYYLGKRLDWEKPIWGILLGASVIAIAFSWKQSTSYYITWVLNIFPIDILKQIPDMLFNNPPDVGLLPLPLLTLSVFWTSLYCLVKDTSAWEKFVSLFGREKVGLDFWNSIFPEPSKKERLIDTIRKIPAPYEKIPGNVKSKLPKPAVNKGVGVIARDKNKKDVTLSSDEIRTHMIIFGSTGSGKTVLLKSLMGMLLDFGYSGTIVDLKEDTAEGEVRDFCRAYSWKNKTPYQEVSLGDPGGGSWWLNSLDGMNADEGLNAIMATQSFDDEYHKSMNKKMAGAAVQLAYALHRAEPNRYGQPSMWSIGEILLNPKGQASAINLVKMRLGYSDSEVKDRFGALLAPTKDDEAESTSFGTKLTNLYNSDAGRDVLRPGNTPWGQPRAQLDLSKEGLVYLGLSSLSKRDHAEALTAGILQRFAVMAAKRSAGEEEKTERFLIIDEASVIDRNMAINLLNKCRGANIRVILATQGPDDWNSGPTQDWEQMSQNHNVTIFMRMPSVNATALSSDFIGAREFASVSHSIDDQRLTGRMTATTEEKPLVQKEELRAMTGGEFIMRVGSPYKLTWAYGYMRGLELDPYMAAGRPLPLSDGGWLSREEYLKHVSEEDVRLQEEAAKREKEGSAPSSTPEPAMSGASAAPSSAGGPPPKKKKPRPAN